MQKRKLGRTDLTIAPLVFGGNVFGWTADKKTSFELLDRISAAGLNAVDTADVYAAWAPGNKGGSPMGPGKKGLKAKYIEEAAEASLRRLQVETIDLYLSHWPDAEAPHEETLGAYAKLIAAGKIRWCGASNYNAEQMRAALDAAKAKGLPRCEVLQPEYNLYDRGSYDGALRDLCIREEIGVITYYSLAKGFLSGKYRSEADLGQSPRGGGVKAYLNPRGFRILAALDEIAAGHKAAPAEVALAWLIQRPGVTAPIASATSLTQLESLIRATAITLGADEVATLDAASAPAE